MMKLSFKLSPDSLTIVMLLFLPKGFTLQPRAAVTLPGVILT